MKRVKTLATFVVSISMSTSLCAKSRVGDPVPPELIVEYNGLEWVWASPCSGLCSYAEPENAPEGWRYAHGTEWASRPPVSAFGDSSRFKCAAAYFDPDWDVCDWSDAVEGFVTNKHNGSGYEMWFVRGDAFSCSPTFDTPFHDLISLQAKAKNVIPVKTWLIDAQGDVIDPTTLPTMPVINVTFAPSSGGVALDVTDALEASVKANEDNVFRVTADGGIMYNLSSKLYEHAGKYTVSVVAGDTSYMIGDCSQSFIRQE